MNVWHMLVWFFFTIQFHCHRSPVYYKQIWAYIFENQIFPQLRPIFFLARFITLSICLFCSFVKKNYAKSSSKNRRRVKLDNYSSKYFFSPKCHKLFEQTRKVCGIFYSVKCFESVRKKTKWKKIFNSSVYSICCCVALSLFEISLIW